MNYQKSPPIYILQILKNYGFDEYDLSYYAWPEMFGSTAGPCSGIGGCAMSTFTIEAWVCNDTGPTVYTCANMYYVDYDRFEPFKKINGWKRIDAKIDDVP